MKELTFTQQNPQFGKVKIILRILGKVLYFKFNNNQYSAQVIEQLKNKGAEVNIGKGWIKVDMFVNQDLVKIGGKEFDVTKNSDEEIEVILSDFYKVQYVKSGFKVGEDG